MRKTAHAHCPLTARNRIGSNRPPGRLACATLIPLRNLLTKLQLRVSHRWKVKARDESFPGWFLTADEFCSCSGRWCERVGQLLLAGAVCFSNDASDREARLDQILVALAQHVQLASAASNPAHGITNSEGIGGNRFEEHEQGNAHVSGATDQVCCPVEHSRLTLATNYRKVLPTARLLGPRPLMSAMKSGRKALRLCWTLFRRFPERLRRSHPS